MILRSLHLTNFRKFKNTYIEFPDGVIGVIGLNGTGKSTLFEAIAWALYGPTAARTTTDTIKREHATTKDPCRITIEFHYNDNAYHILREIKGKNHTAHATLTINNKIIAQGADTVTRYIQKTIGMDFRSFYTSIFAKQKELNALSTMNTSDRKPLILKMLGIDILDTIITDIRTDVRHLHQHLTTLQTQTTQPDGTQKITQYQNQHTNLTNQQHQLKLTINQHTTTITQHTKKLQQHEQETLTHKKHYEHLLTQQEHLHTLQKKLTQREQLHTTILNLTQIITQRKKQLTQYKKSQKNLSTIKQQLTKTTNTQQTITKTINTTIKQIEHLHTTQNHYNQTIKKLQEKQTHIQNLGPDAHCPTCDRILGEQHHHLLKDYSTEITEKNQEITKIQQQITINQKKQEQHQRQLTAITKKIAFLQQQIIDEEKINSIITSLENELEKEEKTLNQNKKEYATLKKISFEPKHQQQIKNQIHKAYTTYQNHLKKTTDQQKKREELRIELEQLKGKLKLLEQQTQNLSKKIKEQKELTKKLKSEQKKFENMKILQETMNGFRTHIISQIRPTLSHYASELFYQLTDGKYTTLELDENYNLKIYDQGTLHPISRFSGGEEDLANLCIRLAISEVLSERAGSNFQFIILDEIFGSQDNNRRQNILATLNRFSAKFHQIFLITHVDEIKHYMEYTIHVTEQEDGISSIEIK